MYKVFINDKLIQLIDDVTDYQLTDGMLYLKHMDEDTMDFAIDFIWESKNFNHLVIFADELDELWDDFKDKFKNITASGGVVRNEKNEVLFILKRGKWDLPKGKVDKGESNRDAALREVQEECGIKELSIGRKLGITYHLYEEEGKRVLKKTHWFAMFTEKNGELVPDKNEGIEKVEWKKNGDLSSILENTYPAIKEVTLLE